MTWLLLSLLATSNAIATPVGCSGKAPRTSPCMPSEEERAELMAQIRAAMRLKEDWESSKTLEERLRGQAILARGRDSSDWRLSAKQLEINERAMRQAFARVAKATQEAYGVGPIRQTGRIHGGLLKGEISVWSPVIQEKESLVYKVERPGKKPVYLSYVEDPDTLGQTLNDGGVIISFKVLENCLAAGSPARLAEVIAHEAAHFEDLTSKKGISGYNSAEASAYARSMEVGAKIGLDIDRSSRIADLHGRFHNRSFELESSGFAGTPYRALPGSTDYPYQLRSDSFQDDWHRQHGRVDAIRRQREELARRHAGSSQEAVDRSGNATDACGYPGVSYGEVDIPSIPCPRTIYTPPPGAIPARPVTLPPAVTVPTLPTPPAPPQFDIWGALKELARKGCSNPLAVTQSELDIIWPKIFGMALYPDAAARLGLTGCDAALLDRLVRWASDYKPARFEVSTFLYEASMSRGEIGGGVTDSTGRPQRDYPMPGPEPCLDGRAVCIPVTPPK